MNWETLLASGVIAAIVSGMFTLIKQKNSNTSRYVISQREKWREKIRELEKDIFFGNSEIRQQALIDLNLRINPYGKFCEYVQIKNHLEEGLSRKEKKTLRQNEKLQEEYYLKDGHIQKVIQKLLLNKDVDENKKLLVDYLSLLIKFDWERAKMESSINKKQIVSIIFDAVALFLAGLYFSPITKLNVVYLIIFGVFFALPYIIVLTETANTSFIRKTSEILVDKWLVTAVLFYGVFMLISIFLENDLICWTFMISVLSVSIKSSFFNDKFKIVKDYISALEKLDKEALLSQTKKSNKI